MNDDDSFVKTCAIPEGAKCLCCDPECSGLTAAFALLGDERQRFIKLPRYKHNPPSPYYVQRNRQREAYLRHLLGPDHPSVYGNVVANHIDAADTSTDRSVGSSLPYLPESFRSPTTVDSIKELRQQQQQQQPSSRFIALHHFHPQLISPRGIPKVVSATQAIRLLRTLYERDQVVVHDENGETTVWTIFVPNYSKQEVQADLLKLTADAKRNSASHETDDEDEPEILKTRHCHETDHPHYPEVTLLLSRLVSAARVCQRFIRRYQAKKALQMARREVAAATCIQTYWRRQRPKLKSQDLECAAIDDSGKSEEESKQLKAALLLQSCVRRWLVASNHEKAATATTVIQANWRGRTAYSDYQQTRRNVVVVQSAWRQSAAMAERNDRLAALLAMQSIVRMQHARNIANKERLKRTHVEQQRQHACVLLQSTVRSHCALSQYQEQKQDTVQCQALARRYLVRTQLQAYRASAIQVQRVWRGCLARDYYATTRQDVVLVQNLVRRSIALDSYTSQLASIQHLQKSVRRWMRMRHVEASRGRVGEGMISENSTDTASCRIQANVRGFLCRKKMAWITMFTRLKAFEIQRRKAYEESFDDACSDWKHCVEVLDDGVREISRADRLLQGASMADRALAESMRAISQDAFLDHDYNVITDHRHRDSIRSARNRAVMPTDQVLKAVLTAEGTRADRVDNAVDSCLSDARPELSLFRQEFEIKVKKVKKVGSSLLRLMSSKGMKAPEKDIQRAWDELETAAQASWRDGVKSRKRTESSLMSAVEKGKTQSAGGRSATTGGSDISAIPNLGESMVDKDASQAAGLAPEVSSSVKGRDALNEDPVTPSRPRKKHVLASSSVPIDRTAYEPSWMRDTCPPLTPVDSPQSASTSGANIPATRDAELTRQLQGWYPFSSDPSVGLEPVIPETRPSGSSPRRLFGSRRSDGRSDVSERASPLLSKQGCQKRGFEFFDHLQDMPPELPSHHTQLFGPSSVEDRWLCEWNYRAATLRLTFLWNACLSLFSKMREAVEHIEGERLTTLADILPAAVSSEKRVLLATTDHDGELVQELLEIRHDMEHLSECMDEMVQHHCRILLQSDNDNCSSIVNRSRCSAPDFSQSICKPLEGNKASSIPHHAVLIERAVSRKAWKPTLAVVTTELHMHMFDLSFIPDIALDSFTTDEAFEKLLPVNGFSADGSFVEREEHILKKVTPVGSVNMRNCRISGSGGVGGGVKDSLEVTETYAGRFRDEATRKFHFRGTAEAMATLKGLLESASYSSSKSSLIFI